MIEEYELPTYDRHEFDYDDMVPGRLPISVIE